MRRRDCLHTLALAGLLIPRPGHADDNTPPPEVLAALPGARLQGRGRLRYLGLHIYDARLWVGPGYAQQAAPRDDYASQPLALELIYARKLDGAQIAARSIDEMERSGKLPADKAQAWLAFMRASFPDVQDGDRIVGVQNPGVGTRYIVNGKPAGELQDAEFTRRFFGIWLAPQTSQPALRRELLGAGA